MAHFQTEFREENLMASIKGFQWTVKYRYNLHILILNLHVFTMTGICRSFTFNGCYQHL